MLDLGRLPTVRTTAGERDLGVSEASVEDLAYVTHRLGDFGDDNRVGLTRTLHRISPIRNRKGEVVGLTLSSSIPISLSAADDCLHPPWDEPSPAWRALAGAFGDRHMG